ncbi:MAG TPA: EF-hand domain-containing protein [Xanthobacteraceae bacterium]
MISRRSAILAAIGGLAGTTIAASAFAKKQQSPVARFDTDHDGTVDLAEAKKAAGDLFDKLDTDKDGTLDIKELKGRLSRKDFASADPDKDKTLTKDEYLAAVEQRFKAADPDNDGMVSAAEFHTRAGRALLQLME